MSAYSSAWQDALDANGPPGDVGAERITLGCIQLNNDLLTESEAVLGGEDFQIEAHRHIWRSMTSLHGQGMSIDPVTLGADLKARGLFEKVGGAAYIASLIDGVPRTDSVSFYARIVKQKSLDRQALNQFYLSMTRLLDGGDRNEILEDFRLFCDRVLTETAAKPSGFYDSLQALFDAEIEDPEVILYGIHRGEVGELAAITNYGKSTLLLNLCLSLAGGQRCLPLVPIAEAPRRVVYVDCESPASRLRSDLRVMLRQISAPGLAVDNFMPVVDAEIEGYPLNLSRKAHLNRLSVIAKKHKADLIVIDTVSSAFELTNENDNAEVARLVMGPLKALARELNCAVIFAHHIGKATETQTGEGAYKSRGASAFGALSRVVFTIEKDAKHGAGYIVLNCAKSKGVMFEPVLMKLNQEERWFEICAEKPTESPKPPTASEIAEHVTGQESTTAEICEVFKHRASERTIRERLQEAERLGLIIKPHKQAKWRIGNRQSLIDLPIADSQIKGSNGHRQSDFAYCGCGATGIRHTSCDRCGEFLR